MESVISELEIIENIIKKLPKEKIEKISIHWKLLERTKVAPNESKFIAIVPEIDITMKTTRNIY